MALQKDVRGSLKKKAVVNFRPAYFLLGSLSNHDDDGNKNPTNLHICQ